MALNTIPAAASLRYNLVYFSSTTTYTIPSTTIGYIDIWAVGPGGGGGRPSTANTTPGTAGGPGQLIYNSNVAVTPSATLTITIPSGGSGSTANDTNATSPTTETTISGIANGGTIIAVGGVGGQRTIGNGISSTTQKGTFQFPSSSSGSAAFGISPTGFSYSATNGTASNGGNGKQIFSQIPNVTNAISFSMSISPTAELLTNFPVTYLHSSAGTSGTNGSTSNGGSSTSTTYFAGQGGTGGISATAGGTGVGGGGGGGGAGTTGGAGGNGSANSGSGGGGGGAGSSTTGNGGNGGSGFVIIQGWW